MKRILILLLCVFFLAGCGTMTKKENSIAEPIKITTGEIASLFPENNYIIIDVREDYEYNSEHVLGALNIPLGKIETITETIAKDMNVILYCRSGNRSNKAAIKLTELGYKNVYDLGGIDSITLEKVSEGK